jgi:hypothetical protein
MDGDVRFRLEGTIGNSGVKNHVQVRMYGFHLKLTRNLGTVWQMSCLVNSKMI